MFERLTDFDRLAIGIVFLLFIMAFLPGLPFMGLFLLLLKLGEKRKLLVYIGFFVLSASGAALFYVSDFTALTYFSSLYGACRMIYGTESTGMIEWRALVLLGLPAGFIMGLLAELYQTARPGWLKKHDFPGKIRRSIGGKKVKMLREAEHPEQGTLLGIKQNGERIIVTDKELNGHCLLLGATGAGKTTTILNFVESAAQRGLPLILVDGKGDNELVERVRRLAGRYGRKFYLFSMSEPKSSKHYNPLRRGNYSELKDKMISMTEWTEPHYQMQAERYLQMAARILQQANIKIDPVNLPEMIEPRRLETAAKTLSEEEGKKVYRVIDEAEKTISGLLNRLAILAESEIGELFKDTGDENTIDLLNGINEKAFIMFSLNSLMFPEYSRLLGRLAVIDLKTTAARLLGQNIKTFCIFDEFGVFAGPQVTDLINKSRGAGFHNILATQELADLRFDGKTELMEQVLGNTNIKIIHRQDVPASAELLASLIGTKDDYMMTQQINEAGATGMGTVKEEKSFLVHPDEIKRLRIGEAFLVQKFPVFKVEFVNIRNVIH